MYLSDEEYCSFLKLTISQSWDTDYIFQNYNCSFEMIFEGDDSQLSQIKEALYVVIDRQAKKAQAKNIQSKSTHPLSLSNSVGFDIQVYEQKIYTFRDLKYCIVLTYLMQNFQQEISTLHFIRQIQEETYHLHQKWKLYFNQFIIGNQYLFGKDNQKRVDRAIIHYKNALEIIPKRFQALNNLSCSLVEKKSISQAKQYLDLAFRINPNSFQINHNLAQVSYKILKSKGQEIIKFDQQINKIIKLYLKSIELNPYNYQAFHNIGNIYVYKKQYQKASEYYLKALQSNQYYAGSFYSLACTYRQMKQYLLSFKTFTKCLKYNKNNYSCLIGLANLLLQTLNSPQNYFESKNICFFQELIESKEYFQLSDLSKLKKIEKIYSKASIMNPKSPVPCVGLGNVNIYLHNYEKALKNFNKAIYLREHYYPAYNGAGLAYFYLQKYNQSLQKYEECLKIKNNEKNALLGKFNVYLKLKKIFQAKQIMSILEVSQSQNELIYYYKALLQSEVNAKNQLIRSGFKYSKNIDASRRCLTSIMLEFGQYQIGLTHLSLISNRSNFTDIDYLIGLCFQHLHNPISAVQSYIKSIESNNKDVNSLLKIAEIYYENQQGVKCMKIINKILSFQSQNIRASLLLSKLLNKQRNYSQSIKVLNLILNFTDQSSHIYNHLSFAYMKTKNFYQSERHLRLGLKKDQTNGLFWNNLGNIQCLSLKFDQAIQSYLKSTQANSQNFAPFVNLSILQIYQQKMEISGDVISKQTLGKMFNLSIFYLIRGQYDQSLGLLIQVISNSSVFLQSKYQILNFIKLHYSGHQLHIKLCLFLLSFSKDKSSSLDYFQDLFSFSIALQKGYENCFKRLDRITSNYTQQNNLTFILQSLQKQTFQISQYQGLKLNDYLCSKFHFYEANTKRKEMISNYQYQVTQSILILKNVIEALINRRQIPKLANITDKQLNQTYIKIQKTERLKELLMAQYDNQVTIQKIKQLFGNSQIAYIVSQVSNMLSVQIKVYQEFQRQFLQVLRPIQEEQQILQDQLNMIGDLQSYLQAFKAIFMDYYNNVYFTNVFIAYVYNSFIFYVQKVEEIDSLKKLFASMKDYLYRDKVYWIQKHMRQILQEIGIISNITYSSRNSRLNLQGSQEVREDNDTTKMVTKTFQVSTNQQIYYLQMEQLNISYEHLESNSYDHYKRLIKQNRQYFKINIIFSKNKKQCISLIKTNQKVKFLYPQLSILQSPAYLLPSFTLSQSRKQIFVLIQSLHKAFIQLQQLGLFNLQVSSGSIIKLEGTYKLTNFDYALQLNPQNALYKYTKQLFKQWLQSKQNQFQANILRFIFKQCEQKLVQQIMLMRNTIQNDDSQKIIEQLINTLRQYSYDYHKRQFIKIIQEILDINKFNDHSVMNQIQEYLQRLKSNPKPFAQAEMIFSHHAEN